MPANQDIARGLHHFDVERLWQVPAITTIHQRTDARIMDLVAIELLERVVRGVEAGGCRFDGLHDDILRQLGIEPLPQSLDRQFAFGRQANHLPERVHTRIGATAGGERGLFAGDGLPSFGERGLHGARTRLNLPTSVFGAIVGNGQLEPAAGVRR